MPSAELAARGGKPSSATRFDSRILGVPGREVGREPFKLKFPAKIQGKSLVCIRLSGIGVVVAWERANELKRPLLQRRRLGQALHGGTVRIVAQAALMAAARWERVHQRRKAVQL